MHSDIPEFPMRQIGNASGPIRTRRSWRVGRDRAKSLKDLQTKRSRIRSLEQSLPIGSKFGCGSKAKGVQTAKLSRDDTSSQFEYAHPEFEQMD